MSFKIFPYTITSEGDKKPLVEWKQESSSDPEVHRQWQVFFKDAIKGYGLPTGKINNLWALDIDNKNGGNGFESLNQLGIQLPQTAHQYTPSGGLHLFFKTNDDIHYPTTVNKDLKVDTRGEGGFVWLYNPRFDLPIIDTPQWVWNVIKKKPKDKNAPPTDQQSLVHLNPSISLDEFNKSIQAVMGAGEGERNHTLNTHAYVIGRLVANGAVPKDYAYERLKIAALAIGLPDKEAHITIMSGLNGGGNAPHTHPFGSTPPHPPSNFTPPIIEQPKYLATRPTLALLMDRSKLKKPQLFENWSTEDIHLTSAIGGVGKTTLKLFEAVCLALGESFLGFRCLRQGKTLIVVGEDTEAKMFSILGAMCDQLKLFDVGNEHKIQAVMNNIAIKRAKDLCLVMQDYKTKTYQPNSEAMQKVRDMIDDFQPNMIVFDPIAMFWGKEADGNDMAMGLAKAMQEIQEYSNACVDMIAHIGKDSFSKKDVSQFSSRGGTALPNHSRVVRTLLALSDAEFKEETGEELGDKQSGIYIYTSKFSDGSPILHKPFCALRNGFVYERKDIIEKTKTQDVNNVSENKMRLFNYIKSNSTEAKPVTEEHLVSHFYLETPKVKKSDAKAIINMLKIDGLIEEVSHPDMLIGRWLKSSI